MKFEYPKMVYKTREDTQTVNSLEEEEAAIEEGYGSYTIIVLGKKPKSVEVKKVEIIKPVDLTTPIKPKGKAAQKPKAKSKATGKKTVKADGNSK